MIYDVKLDEVDDGRFEMLMSTFLLCSTFVLYCTVLLILIALFVE